MDYSESGAVQRIVRPAFAVITDKVNHSTKSDHAVTVRACRVSLLKIRELLESKSEQRGNHRIWNGGKTLRVDNVTLRPNKWAYILKKGVEASAGSWVRSTCQYRTCLEHIAIHQVASAVHLQCWYRFRYFCRRYCLYERVRRRLQVRFVV